jgi:hypothetical protein
VLAPELVDEALARDGLVRAQEQQCQQRTLVAAAERQRQAVLDYLQRPQDPELEPSPVVTKFTKV